MNPLILLLLVPKVWAILIPSITSFHLDQFRAMKLTVENELQSLMPKSAVGIDSDNELVIIPRCLLVNKIDFYNCPSTNLELGLSGETLQLSVPQSIKSLFLLQTNSLTKEFDVESVSSSMPFRFPTYTNLIDFYLVVTKRYKEANFAPLSSAIENSILCVPTKKVPVFQDLVQDEVPTLVFMFNDKKEDIGQCMESVVTMENHLSHGARFFDNFAKKWVQNFGVSSLRQSIFCLTNPNEVSYSFCTAVEEDLERVHSFPAFNFARLKKRSGEMEEQEEEQFEKKHKSDEKMDHEKVEDNTDVTKESEETQQSDPVSNESSDVIEAHVIKQLHGKLSSKADRFNDVTYDMFYDPKKLIKETDASVDEKVQDRIRRIKQAKEDFIEGIQETKDAITERIDTKKSEVASKIVEGLGGEAEADEEEQSEFMENLEKIQSGKYDDKYSYDIYNHKRDSNIYEREDKLDMYIPLSVIDDNEAKPPRLKEYSQIYQHLKSWNMTSKFSKRLNVEECVEITWYNIFHHSIFGNPKFCMNE